MNDPSAISGILGLTIVVALVAILGLMVEWIWEHDDYNN